MGGTRSAVVDMDTAAFLFAYTEVECRQEVNGNKKRQLVKLFGIFNGYIELNLRMNCAHVIAIYWK